jgi:RNA polymerase sigma factor (sigma-70 family)
MKPAHPLADARFLRYVRAVLRRRGIPAQYLDDAVGEVVVRTLQALVGREAPAPGDEAQWRALAATVARNYAHNERKKRKAREELGDAGLVEDADAYELLPSDDWRDPVDARLLLGILQEQFDSGEMPEHGEHILQGVADDASHEEIAGELGISRSAVKNRLLRMRRKFEEKVDEMGLSHLRRGKKP